MTRHKHAHTGLVTPQLPQLWLTAVLRLAAMLVHLVASTLQMICRRTRVNATRATPTDLPQAKTDTQSKKVELAAQQSSPKALILRDRMHAVRTAELSRAIVSKDGKGVLTKASHKLPQHREHPNNARSHLRSSRRKSGPRASWELHATGLHQQPWIPACAGTSGENTAAPLN